MKKRPARPAAWMAALATLPPPARPVIDRLWDTAGRLAPGDVAELMRICASDLPGVMMRLLPFAQQYAIVPVSHYQVGAVAAGNAHGGATPALYFGANIEFGGIALNFTVHAEQCAVNNAWLNGETGLSQLAVTAAPCGHCRQFLNELAGGPDLVVHLPGAIPGTSTATPLHELLPRAFGPRDLEIEGGLMDPRANAPTLRVKRGADKDPLVALALAAAQRSYAPYPTDKAGQFCGVAVEFGDGSTSAGRYAGNAAYNPSLSPLQSALAFGHLNRAADATRRIRRCVLVEVPTLASQRSATEALLRLLAPRVKLEYLAAK